MVFYRLLRGAFEEWIEFRRQCAKDEQVVHFRWMFLPVRQR